MSHARPTSQKKIRLESKFVNNPAVRREARSIVDALREVDRPISQSSSMAIEIVKPATIQAEVKYEHSVTTTQNMNWSLPGQDDEDALDHPMPEAVSKVILPAIDVTLFCEKAPEAPLNQNRGTIAPDGYFYQLAGQLTIKVYDVKSKQCIKTIPIPEFKETDLDLDCFMETSTNQLRWCGLLVTGNHHIILWNIMGPCKTIILDPKTHQIKHELNGCYLEGPFHHLNDSQFFGLLASKDRKENGFCFFELTTEKFTRQKIDACITGRPSQRSYDSLKSLPNKKDAKKIIMSANANIFTLADGRIVEGSRITNVVSGLVENETTPVGITKMQFGVQLEKWEKNASGELIREAVLPLQYETHAPLSEITVLSSNTICLLTHVKIPNAGRRNWQLKIIDTDNMKEIKDFGIFYHLDMFCIGTDLLMHEEKSDKVYFLDAETLELHEEKLPCPTTKLKQISDDEFFLKKEDDTWMKIKIAYKVISATITDSVTCLPTELVRLIASYYPKICEFPVVQPIARQIEQAIPSQSPRALSSMSMFASSNAMDIVDDTKENESGLTKQQNL